MGRSTEGELAFVTIEEAAPRLASGDLSPVKLTKAVLERVGGAELLGATYIDLLAESALAEAKGAEAEIAAGNYRGMLHGIPVGAKEVFAVTGLVNHAGSRAWSPPAATEDAEIVRRLRAAGAVLVGTHHLYEFAMGGTAANPHFGTLPNP